MAARTDSVILRLIVVEIRWDFRSWPVDNSVLYLPLELSATIMIGVVIR